MQVLHKLKNESSYVQISPKRVGNKSTPRFISVILSNLPVTF